MCTLAEGSAPCFARLRRGVLSFIGTKQVAAIPIRLFTSSAIARPGKPISSAGVRLSGLACHHHSLI